MEHPILFYALKHIIDAFWCWLEKLNVLKGSTLFKAVTYAKNQKVNMTKSKVDRPNGLKYLGFGFYFDIRAHQYKAKPHEKSVGKFKVRMKQLTCRSWGVSNAYKVQKLNELIRGWINYFEIGSMKYLCREMDKHIRYRLRMCIWKQWKTPQNRAKNLITLGVDNDIAWTTAYTGNRIAYVCQRRVMNFAINKD